MLALAATLVEYFWALSNISGSCLVFWVFVWSILCFSEQYNTRTEIHIIVKRGHSRQEGVSLTEKRKAPAASLFSRKCRLGTPTHIQMPFI